jgi:NADPH-dependent 2,4-dienoyl-CoA reductase/sulfur reductase-like enzyme
VALGWAGVRVAQYVRSRNRALEITVAGADPVRLPIPGSDRPVERLQDLLATESGTNR